MPKSNKKFFGMKLRLTNGEYHYDYTYLISANDEDEATAFAENHVNDFYGKPCDRDGDVYYFHAGCVAVKMVNVWETTPTDFFNTQINFLGRPMPAFSVSVG